MGCQPKKTNVTLAPPPPRAPTRSLRAPERSLQIFLRSLQIFLRCLQIFPTRTVEKDAESVAAQ